VTARPLVAACYWHRRKELPYLAWHADAEYRDKIGQQQRQCPDCKLWLWPDEFGEEPS
jgi:hypothetical protein